MRYYEVTMYPNSGYEGIYVYAKTSFDIFLYTTRFWFLLKKRDGKISIWYGGRLFKRGKDIYMQLEASNSEKYRKIVEERYWMSSEKLEIG